MKFPVSGSSAKKSWCSGRERQSRLSFIGVLANSRIDRSDSGKISTCGNFFPRIRPQHRWIFQRDTKLQWPRELEAGLQLGSKNILDIENVIMKIIRYDESYRKNWLCQRTAGWKCAHHYRRRLRRVRSQQRESAG